MNTKKLLEWAEIARQAQQGKIREARRADGLSPWFPISAQDRQADWWDAIYEYRIKPEAREIWLSVDQLSDAYRKGGAEGWLNSTAPADNDHSRIWRKFREVIERATSPIDSLNSGEIPRRVQAHWTPCKMGNVALVGRVQFW